VENAKLLLASDVANKNNKELGHNLMDHPFSYTWALAPQSMGSFRGPIQTSGIETLRDGEFRKDFAAFRTDVGNAGWDIVNYPPNGDVQGALAQNVFGRKLRNQLATTLPRQIRIGFDIEQLPEWKNCVSISREFKDAIGCYRPILTYDVSDYSWQAMVEAMKVSRAVFDALGIPKADQHFTGRIDGVADSRRYIAPDGKAWDLNFIGAGHHIGTHRMGTTKSNSVVNRDQRSWDHDKLYVVGCGSFPTTGTANPTLTAVALALRSVKDMLTQLR
jgi:choline dehydrogenase-like flavoprotein